VKKSMVELVVVENDAQVDDVRQLFKEYTASLGFDLHFQEYDREYAHLPGEYQPPSGRLYLALCDGNIAGCVALRRFEDSICEMKRMYVKPEYRGRGIGRKMAEKVISEARKIGYKRMRLDTIDTMAAAITLYESMGFKPIKPYRLNPIRGAYFMELVL
jgi:putative acetyltransferase